MGTNRVNIRALALLRQLDVNTFLESDATYFGTLTLDQAKSQRILELRDVADAVFWSVLLVSAYETREMALLYAVLAAPVRAAAAKTVVEKFRDKVAAVEAATTLQGVAGTTWVAAASAVGR